MFLHRGIALGHAALQGNSAFDGIDHTAELGEKTISHELKDTPMVILDLGLEELFPVGTESLEGSGLVLLH